MKKLLAGITAMGLTIGTAYADLFKGAARIQLYMEHCPGPSYIQPPVNVQLLLLKLRLNQPGAIYGHYTKMTHNIEAEIESLKGNKKLYWLVWCGMTEREIKEMHE